MTRAITAATGVALEKPIVPLCVIVKLDILGDPLLCWSGIGDLAFGAGQTGDAQLDGFTFTGTGTLIEIGSLSDGVGGSDVLEIALPGVEITDPMLRQIIYNRNRWQFRRAWVWMMLLDEDTGNLVGMPFRVKTGRMDGMPYSENNKGGTIRCRIEGQQAYGDEPLNTRYSEQSLINPNDNSQNWVRSLANMTAALGQKSASAGSFGGGRAFDADSHVRER